MMPSLVRKYIVSLIPRFVPHSLVLPSRARWGVQSSPPAVLDRFEAGTERKGGEFVEIQRS